jgi:26S proteasome regulatory subunit N5
MSRREKTEFILEQVALCIEKGDWTQAGILSRKISTRYFGRKPKKTPAQLVEAEEKKKAEEKKRNPDDPPPEPEDDVTDLKLRYYELQVILSKHEDKYLETCKHYRQVLDTEAVEDNTDMLRSVGAH